MGTQRARDTKDSIRGARVSEDGIQRAKVSIEINEQTGSWQPTHSVVGTERAGIISTVLLKLILLLAQPGLILINFLNSVKGDQDVVAKTSAKAMVNNVGILLKNPTLIGIANRDERIKDSYESIKKIYEAHTSNETESSMSLNFKKHVACSFNALKNAVLSRFKPEFCKDKELIRMFKLIGAEIEKDPTTSMQIAAAE